MSLKLVVAASAVTVLAIVAGGSPAHAQDQNKPAEAPKNVVVQAGDSLEKIASANQTTYSRLFDANTQISHPDVIHPGENVRIPKADEQLQSRALPSVAAAPKPVAAVKAKGQGYKRTAAAASSPAGGGDWDRLAQCEAGGNWNTNTGNGYSGGLQFSDSSWRGAGGSGKAANASRDEQIQRGEALKAKQGWGAWPACSKKLGLR